ncbi:biotin--[acetyl-CoA-carboxylase] ligase [Croceivirga lutea]|uniref:biotin--[acetyl-CoA-carboxylase] ligase n=1 Tax=Croceivirga lutea TaxID=1775167 RepID=UPI00163AD874|nr:biotin--[acetyl-CoA-carboxylase] ligase [Croceivirga lutea]GGG52450.1 biotin--[acetyl-CoA-carboxylase] ligase [Croceivirga lutea]
MKLIKLNAIDSTNDYLKDLIRKNDVENYTIVSCDYQLKGRGQRGNQWNSEAGKNLMFSVLRLFDGFEIRNAFYLNMIASLAVYNALNNRNVPNLKVKWPNDIMSGNQKLCGILIENMLQGSYIAKSIVGIGLNVNQKIFQNQPKATSVSLVTGQDFNLDELLVEIFTNLKLEFDNFNPETILERYQQNLFHFKTKEHYVDKLGNQFLGIITEVISNGNLIVEMPDGELQSYAFKEIEFIY